MAAQDEPRSSDDDRAGVARLAVSVPAVVTRRRAAAVLGTERTAWAGGALGGPLSIGLSWRAAGLAPLFPVFAGTLTWTDGELQLVGVYAPPGGEIGLVADRLVLNVAARGTARWLLGRIAAVMRGEAG